MSSKNRRGGLGRGLGALIPTAPPDDVAEQSGGGRPPGYPPMPPYDGKADPAAQAAPSGDELPEPPADYQAGAPVRESEPAAETEGEPSVEWPADLSAERQPERVPDELVPVAGAQFVEVAVQEIRPNPKQPRQVFDEDALAELTHSIREFGVLQPIVVRRVDDGYELVMGERRLRAAATAGLTTVPAIVRTTADDAMLRDALLENIHRAQLNPLEEAAAYQQLLEEFGATHDELATRIGRSRPQVSNTIRLLNLPVPVQRRVAVGILSAGHARALLGIEDGDAQEDLAGRIVAEGLSVRATEELVALHASGHGAKPGRTKASTPRITAPALVELADRLSDAFDTRVKVELGRTKGKITVEFATIDDLERIVLVMSGQLAAQSAQPVRELDPPGVGAAAGEDSGPELSGQESDTGSAGESDQEPGAPAAETVGPDYAGWGDDHVSDLGAWDERTRYDPNES